MEYDFLPEVFGGDGLVTSTVFQGVGDASGNFVYTYEIELFDAPPASVGAVLGITFEFSSIPVAVAGVGDAFYVTDDSGTHAPDLAFYQEASLTAGFRFVPQITNGRTSHQFGLFSPNAAAETVAQVIDSGARGGESIVLSNGAPQGGPNLPEPSAAALFALGFLTIARFCRTRSRA